jgi:hypothetical protein
MKSSVDLTAPTILLAHHVRIERPEGHPENPLRPLARHRYPDRIRTAEIILVQNWLERVKTRVPVYH